MIRIYVATAGVSSVEAEEDMTVSQALEGAGHNIASIAASLESGHLELLLDGAVAKMDTEVTANSVIIIAGEWEAGGSG